MDIERSQRIQIMEAALTHPAGVLIRYCNGQMAKNEQKVFRNIRNQTNQSRYRPLIFKVTPEGNLFVKLRRAASVGNVPLEWTEHGLRKD